MRITENATKAILEVMQKKRMNPQQVFLEIGIFEGNLGLGFTKERRGNVLQFGSLSVVVANGVKTSDFVIDFGEINGRKGLLFTGENNARNCVDGASSRGSKESHGGTTI